MRGNPERPSSKRKLNSRSKNFVKLLLGPFRFERVSWLLLDSGRPALRRFAASSAVRAAPAAQCTSKKGYPDYVVFLAYSFPDPKSSTSVFMSEP